MYFFPTVTAITTNDLDQLGLNRLQTYVLIPKQTKFLMEYSW